MGFTIELEKGIAGDHNLNMPELILSTLFENGRQHLDPDLFSRSEATLEGLRRGLMALSRLESHPFSHLPPSRKVVAGVNREVRDLKREGVERIVVAGIGGSSLGGRVLCEKPGSRVTFLEGIDPEDRAAVLASIDWKRTALNIISKSGGTLETLVNASLAIAELKRALPTEWRKRVLLTTSPGNGRLHQWAAGEGVKTIELPAAVGGRFSVLTPVGLLPAAFDGLDPAAIVLGAKRGADKSLLFKGPENPALALALILVTFFSSGLGEVDLWGYGGRPYLFARWVQQLWGESLGRRIGESSSHRVGVTPMACAGSADQHSLLQLFVDGPPNRWVLFLTQDSAGIKLSDDDRAFAGLTKEVENTGMIQEALWRGTARALDESGTPVARYHLGNADEEATGEAFFVFQAATVYAAGLMEIDPFGQPGVEAGKRFTRQLLQTGRGYME